jgi:hypothetical protein
MSSGKPEAMYLNRRAVLRSRWREAPHILWL